MYIHEARCLMREGEMGWRCLRHGQAAADEIGRERLRSLIEPSER